MAFTVPVKNVKHLKKMSVLENGKTKQIIS